MRNSRIPVIIDTDIGDDIDDAFALCLAIKSPELEILGVTTVYRDTTRRAKIAKRLFRLAGRPDVPIVAGCGTSINNPLKFGKAQDFAAKPDTYIDEIDDEVIDTDKNAITFLYETIKASEIPVTIITIGALTNIAILLRQYTDVKDNIRQIVMMGGAYFMNFSEHNISCDPEAAQIVLDSGIEILGVGLDVTFKCKLEEDHLRQLDNHQHPCIKFLMAMRRNWKHDVFLHDPLAVALAFDPSYVTSKKLRYAVELTGTYTKGMTINLSNYNWSRNPDESNFSVCETVENDRFVKMYMERLLSF